MPKSPELDSERDFVQTLFAETLFRLIELHIKEVLERPEPQQKEHLSMTVVTNNDSAVRLKPTAFDRDGIAVPATNLQATVDQADVASVTADPDNPSQFLVQPLPSADPNAGSRTVIVTTLDPATGISVQTPIEFDPGGESSLAVDTEIVSLASLATAGGQTGNGSATGEAGGNTGAENTSGDSSAALNAVPGGSEPSA